MRIQRIWAMPNSETFSCPPIGDFVKKYLTKSEISIDPFARDKRWATFTNDLNPNTTAEFHMKALYFLQMLVAQGVQVDLIIFDPPYSMRQVKECYDSFGDEKFTNEDSQNCIKWTAEKLLCNELLVPDGIFLHFGWHTNGLYKYHHAKIEEILLVAHGGGHNDTICMAERKMGHQGVLCSA